MKKKFLLVGLSLIAYFIIGYLISRDQFMPFIGLYASLFVLYYFICKSQVSERREFRFLILGALVCRLVFLFATPELSDDFWRYLWDGQLQYSGQNPYAYTPSQWMQLQQDQPVYMQSLYTQLNSPDYYSVYPPINQWIFYASVYFFPDNITASTTCLHSIVWCFECGTLFFLLKLIGLLGISKHRVMLYAFNPLIIIEFSGNLHTEASMLFFLTLALYSLFNNKLWQSALSFSIAVMVKLIPLILLPLIAARLKIRKAVFYCTFVATSCLVFVYGYFDIQNLNNFRDSLQLYAATFEFNAGIYYFFRYGLLNNYWEYWEVHSFFYAVKWLESFLSSDVYYFLKCLLQALFVLYVIKTAFKLYFRVNQLLFFNSLLWVYFVYFLLSATIHPWYISPLILLSVFCTWRYAIVWSFLIGLSYATYQTALMQESLPMITIEYCFLFIYLLYEIKKSKSKEIKSLQLS